MVCLLVAIGIVFGCVPLEKRVDLTYQKSVTGQWGSGDVFVTRPVVEPDMPLVPGSLPVIGTVGETGARIIATGDVADWVMAALMQELYAAGYEVRTVPQIPAAAAKGVRVRVTRLSVNQKTDGLLITTSTDIAMEADIRKNGRLVTTLNVSAGGQDQGFDGSASFISEALQKVLQSAMQQLLPGIVKTLEG
jgi:hypothetical protein